MKKVLLIGLMLCFAMAAIAQKGTTTQVYKAKPIAELDRTQMIYPSETPSAPSVAEQRTPVKQTVAGRDITFVPIGSSGNAFGAYGNGRTYLWADPRINSVAYVHRMLGDAQPYGNSQVAYDVSWQGGADGTWSTDLKVYEPLAPGTPYPVAAGRYPQGGILNPPGNTDPDNAYFCYFIPTLDNSNLCGTNPWGGLAHGANVLTQVDPPASTQTNLETDDEFFNLIPDAYHITVDGHVWMVDLNWPCVAGAYAWDGTIHTFHGVWDDDEGDVVFDEYLLEGYFEDGDQSNDINIAFGPDGQVGYMCFMSRAEVSDPQQGNLHHPILLKTTDGGEDWSDPIHVLLGGYDGIESIKYFIPDSSLYNTEDYGDGFDRDTIWYWMGYDVDMVIDAYDNPHIFGLVMLATPDGIYSYPEYWGMFHIFSRDGGETYDANLLYKNKTWNGTVGGSTNGITIYNRPQLATTMEAKHVFISFMDTDYPDVTTNIHPDIYVTAYDVDNDDYVTDPDTGDTIVNMTLGSQAWYAAFETSQSYYVFSELEGNTLTCTVPFVYMEMDELNGGNPVDFWYIDGWTYEFTVENAFPAPSNLSAMVMCYDVELMWDAPGSGEPIGYNVYRDGLLVNPDPILELTYMDSGVDPGTYVYTVTAVYDEGESDPTPGFTVEVEALNPVTDLVLDNEPGSPDVMISWSAPARDLDGYNVWRNDVKINETLVTDLFFEDLGLENGEYTYCVTAVYQEVCESEPVCGQESIIIAVGIEELDNSFRIYPNPVKGLLNMEFNTEVKSVKIMNDMGMVVYSNERVNRNKILQVNVASFETGIYFVQVMTDKGMAAKKLTVH